MSVWRELPLPNDVEQLASRVRGVALRVHREVGPGSREHVYQTCLAHALREEGLCVAERVPLAVRFRGLTIHRAAEADMIVNEALIIELKARDHVHPSHVAQLPGYLQATGHPMGLVFNFHAPRLRTGTERVVHPRCLLLER